MANYNVFFVYLDTDDENRIIPSVAITMFDYPALPQCLLSAALHTDKITGNDAILAVVCGNYFRFDRTFATEETRADLISFYDANEAKYNHVASRLANRFDPTNIHYIIGDCIFSLAYKDSVTLEKFMGN
jgi:hypothetical protein